MRPLRDVKKKRLLLRLSSDDYIDPTRLFYLATLFSLLLGSLRLLLFLLISSYCQPQHGHVETTTNKNLLIFHSLDIVRQKGRRSSLDVATDVVAMNFSSLSFSFFKK